MTLYARSDIAAVSVSPDTFGGCGKAHHRPASDGNPVAVWALDCPQCEDHLRSELHTGLWATTPSKIPETYDEAANREENEKRSAREQQAVGSVALAKIAEHLDLLRAVPTWRNGTTGPESPVLCPDGHENPSGSKFCTECGSALAAPRPVTCAAGHESPAGSKFCVECGKPAGAETPAAPAPVDETPEAAIRRQLDWPLNLPPAGAITTPILPVPAGEPPAGPATGTSVPASAAKPEPAPDLASLHVATLKKMCRDAGLKDGGTKGDLIKRLQRARKAAGAV